MSRETNLEMRHSASAGNENDLGPAFRGSLVGENNFGKAHSPQIED